MKKIITAGITALTLTLAGCGGMQADTATTSTSGSPTTSSTGSTGSEANSTTPTATTESITEPASTSHITPDEAQEMLDQSIADSDDTGAGPRPPISEMTPLDSFGYVGMYFDPDRGNYYLCDSRGYASMVVMGEDGCTAPGDYYETLQAFEDGLTAAFEAEGLEVGP